MSETEREINPNYDTGRWVCVACWTEGLGSLPCACPSCGSVRLWATANAGSVHFRSMQDCFYDYLGAAVAKHGIWIGEMLGDGFTRVAPTPRIATEAAISAVEMRRTTSPLLLEEGGGPSESELSAAPTLVNWHLSLGSDNRIRAAGRVRFGTTEQTSVISTTAVILLDPALRWLRTLTTVYNLGRGYPLIHGVQSAENA